MKEKIEEKFGENVDLTNNSNNNLNKEYDETKVVNVNNLIKKKKKIENDNLSSDNVKVNVNINTNTNSCDNNYVNYNEITLKEEELSQNSKKENIDTMNLSHHKNLKGKSTSKKQRTDDDIVIEDN